MYSVGLGERLNKYSNPVIDMRGKMRSAKSYVAGFKIGEPLDGSGVSEVVDSKNASFPVGTIVTGMVGWEEYTVVAGAQGLRAIPHTPNSKIPLSAYIGVLGMPVRIFTARNVMKNCFILMRY